MKKKALVWSCIYYVSIPLFFYGVLHLCALGLRSAGGINNLGAVILAAYGLIFVVIPATTATLMRFSLLKWYLDPFAAAEAPIFLYCVIVVSHMESTNSVSSAVLEASKSLSENGGEGWLFLACLFIFGLMASFSVSRKNGENISYRLISKLSVQ